MCVCLCVSACVCLCVIECVWRHIDPPGSNSLFCRSLVQFHTCLSHAARHRLLLHCPEEMCIFSVFAVWKCVWLGKVQKWSVGPLAWRFVSHTHWAVGSWVLFFSAAPPCFLSDSHIHKHTHTLTLTQFTVHTHIVYTLYIHAFLSHELIRKHILQKYCSTKHMNLHIDSSPPPTHTHTHTQNKNPYLIASVVAACSAEASEEKKETVGNRQRQKKRDAFPI